MDCPCPTLFKRIAYCSDCPNKASQIKCQWEPMEWVDHKYCNSPADMHCVDDDTYYCGVHWVMLGPNNYEWRELVND